MSLAFLAADVNAITVPTETLAPHGETNAYVVDTVLIDPAGRTAELDRAVGGVEHVVLTHTHPDHVGGVAHYADACDATVWARQGREERFERATGVAPDRTFRGGTTVGPLTVIETPGHAPDHVAFATDREIVAGDLAVADGSVVVAAGEGDLRAYLTSLRRLYARNPAVLHPGHGPAIENPRRTIRRLIDHRLHREERVLDAVRSGARTLPSVTDAAYDKDISAVREFAEKTVAAHLEKLAVEGDVTWDGERARST
ncbi:beta-lactamase domain protein [Haladaptatus paucihalophilus DX253]|uniref:Beta-lactamase domain protein n=1 Tax=Haladaptatus paucihalophilus DX253 TaxID=797209 RepID=E7QWX6_HALPU|nr:MULTISPECIES: MBL fold metallo-hydrolase [Haladaptatus]EFW90779.1 beta-lactamase domain protein [Haladaptatus paucihalophilus DX253]GKZ15704.1 MBL fold hydrolase [Haladaptatus sp. T7]